MPWASTVRLDDHQVGGYINTQAAAKSTGHLRLYKHDSTFGTMSRTPTSPMGRIVPRKVAGLISDALADTRVVLVNGARQTGKSTLVSSVCRDRAGEWRNLDRALERAAAHADPVEFIQSDGLMVIDEIQRQPDLLLAIKASVDEDPRPGRFLLTGSARVLGLRGLPDALPGRMDTIELWPLSQGEIDGTGERFIDAVFDRSTPFSHTSTLARSDYIERLCRGGYPEAVAREGARRDRFYDNYVSDLINRDVVQLSEIERGREMRTLTRLLAARSGQLLMPHKLAGELGITGPTVARYVGLLEEVFLVKRLPAWSRNLSSRAVSAPKVAMVDSGIAANLLGQNPRRLARPESPLGGLLEGFVAMELARQLEWSSTRAELFHYRTRDGVEVDLVLEERSGEVVAMDVKASSTVRAEDFRGIRHLKERLGPDFVAGCVLHTGQETRSFGDGLWAIPISAIWEV
jgi:predicted AAA+ superfamily ATPase